MMFMKYNAPNPLLIKKDGNLLQHKGHHPNLNKKKFTQ